jgi:RNA polymerase sigma factor (sigma-70 family)
VLHFFDRESHAGGFSSPQISGLAREELLALGDAADALPVVPLSAGERTLFDALFRKHHETVLRLLRRRLSNEDDVAELAQEAFLRVLRYRECKPAARRYLLMRTALNLAASHLRQARCNKPHVSLHELEIVQDAPGLDDQLDQAQCEQRLLVAIDGLPARRREVLLLRLVQELSYREIAERCGISLAAVEKHLWRAQAAIRERVGGR